MGKFMGIWESFSFGLKATILFASAVTAATLLGRQVLKIVKWFKQKKDQVDWLMSEQHDHELIKDSLKQIQRELTENGGSGTIKDAICDIRDSLDFNSSYMRTALHANPKAVFETDRNGHVTYVNRAFMRMTEFSQHEVMDMGWVNLIAPHSRDRVIEQWMQAVKAKRDFDEVVPYVKPDGTEYPVHAIAHTIRVSGKMVGHLGEIIPLENNL